MLNLRLENKSRERRMLDRWRLGILAALAVYVAFLWLRHNRLRLKHSWRQLREDFARAVYENRQ